MNRKTDFLDLIAKYEDAKFPLWDYMDLNDDMNIEHRLLRTISELEWVKSVCINSLERIKKGIDPEKLERLILIHKL